MTYSVIVDLEAKADLLRLYDHLLQRAEYVEDLEVADRAVPFGASGYVPKYEIASPQLVVVLAVRHQHEADYH